MKSNGILSRYMRPGYSRGKFVQEAKGGESMDMAFKKKKRDFFNLNLEERKTLPIEFMKGH